MMETTINWTTVDGCLKKTFKFSDFVEAVNFVNKVMPLAEKQNHHPDLFIHSYNKVDVLLKTHDANAITEKDHALAGMIDGIG